ncbi:cell envelope integrity protein TolA [Pseudomonas mangrovi]|uniref:Cell envelope integrity protein TolA n=1 Tax=Pseudomonas mangrovi TaxID=2161748 RepID=A0A2T5P519_9PSED|nr:cell envelope integrity protein TolA [Pseudomonas mangrovi]PTU72777.1 cell envelope integrity protein TolA [Pseudomonas mangrovi]
MHSPERSSAQSYFWPVVLAVGLHVLLFAMLFVSFAFTPELPPARPIVQATLYELKSKSPATVQTNQKIAGEAQKTAARQYEVEQLEQKKIEQQKQEQAKAAEQKRAEEARKADAAKAEAKKAEQLKQAEIAKKKAEEDKKKAEAEKKKAEDAKKKLAEEQKRKAAEEAKKKQAQVEAARKAVDDKKAQALAELLSDTTERQAALGDEIGDSVTGSLDDLIRLRAAEGWNRPPSARPNMIVTLRVTMVPDGTITGVNVARSSGDVSFDNSAVAAVRNIGRLTEMQALKPQEFNRYRSFTMTFTPEDLAL